MPEKSCESEALSLNFEPDLQVAYLNSRKQEELVADEICEADIQEGKQQFDISGFRRIFLICGPSKFLGKFDSFSLRIPQAFEANIMVGDAFVFCNRGGRQVSILQWQGDGFAQYFKRSDYGHFPWPTRKYAEAVEVSAQDLKMLLEYPRLMMRLSGVLAAEFSA
jgi:hypothetical protein